VDGEPTRTVAVIGASGDHRKFGNKCVRAHQAADWRVFPVNPHEAEIEGLAAHRSIAEVPARLDRVAVYLPPPRTLRVLPEIAAKGAGEVYLNPGTWDEAVVAEADRLGIPHLRACAIVALGMRPSQFP
jgi:predicted CoA-binding protein